MTSLDAASKDFDSLRGRLIALVQSVFLDWMDFHVASFGNVLLEMYAFVTSHPKCGGSLSRPSCVHSS